MVEQIYPYVQIVHLICAIIFLGYIFFDVVIFSRLKGALGADFERVKKAIGSRAIKIMPVCLFTLIITGGMMMSRWVGSANGGYFGTPLQKIFMLKVTLALIIAVCVAINLSCRAMGRPAPEFLRVNIHKIALTFGFIIVLCAKLMFVV